MKTTCLPLTPPPLARTYVHTPFFRVVPRVVYAFQRTESYDRLVFILIPVWSFTCPSLGGFRCSYCFSSVVRRFKCVVFGHSNALFLTRCMHREAWVSGWCWCFGGFRVFLVAGWVLSAGGGVGDSNLTRSPGGGVLCPRGVYLRGEMGGGVG